MSYFVEVPDLEHGLAVVQGVLEEAISGGKGVMLAPQKRAVRQDEGFEEVEVVAPNAVADIDGSARDCPRSGVELCAGVGGLEHVPVRVDEVAHPQAIVRTVHHVTPLQPIRPVRIPARVRAPKIIAYIK